ncbi:MAG: hypothetical protein VZR11_05510 [Succinimonas sp.]|nr:hypothetical protein [Succinimonas sp.]
MRIIWWCSWNGGIEPGKAPPVYWCALNLDGTMRASVNDDAARKHLE